MVVRAGYKGYRWTCTDRRTIDGEGCLRARQRLLVRDAARATGSNGAQLTIEGERSAQELDYNRPCLCRRLQRWKAGPYAAVEGPQMLFPSSARCVGYQTRRHHRLGGRGDGRRGSRPGGPLASDETRPGSLRGLAPSRRMPRCEPCPAPRPHRRR